MRIILFALFYLTVSSAHAYPEFIGYGYSSCMTCHYNGAGGGALSDYGKAVWAAEIAAVPFWSPKKTNDELSAESGIAPEGALPWWWRPGVKYRGLYYQVDPGSQQSISRYMQMQLDVNSAFFLDKGQKHTIVMSGGYAPTPQGAQQGSDAAKNFISREIYYKWQAQKKSWLYFGFLDKIYGIRTPDHTAYSRKATGIAQNDQVHSVVYQTQENNHEYFVQLFAGNLLQKEELRQKGVSTLYEYQAGENFRIGGSALYSENKYVQQARAAFIGRLGLQNGHSMQTEIGLVRDQGKIDSKTYLGAYSMLEGVARLKRGVHMVSTAEFYKRSLEANQADNLRWRVGALYFPAQRYEFRFDLVNSRSISPDGVKEAGWSIQSQLHLSF